MSGGLLRPGAPRIERRSRGTGTGHPRPDHAVLTPDHADRRLAPSASRTRLSNSIRDRAHCRK
eukprot:1093332-Alexandrium_andersonii.AAC.1